ncbi:NAD-dependent epimerase/dehydratase family protein [Pontibacter flavimaris]|uniref:NAD-dependent epimerase/dehydratase domain-containing protein n=1 Tax=Pontibacter flavimaris TaxID=1797110 RepID=A0A1Q5PCT4_9BACT|nr:NAD-dependent epimerase/dehydratase family protein [Pontibacter flavimaris]OKL40014.1 hypothetical protein A3841_16765 [Pontibacter flavimaris]
MRIVLLGASGQLGSHILPRLRQDYPQAEVVGCVRGEGFPEVSDALHLLQFNPFQDDWATLGQVDVLINCIGIIRESAALDFEEAHVGLTRRMLQHRELIGSPRLIQLSALGADENSPSRFLRTKGLADKELLRHPDTVVLRPSIVCTPGTMLSRKLQQLQKLCRLTGGILPFPARMLETKLQPVAVEDLTELVSRLCVIADKPDVVEVGGKEVYTLNQLLLLIPTCRKIISFPQAGFNTLFPVLSWLFPSLLDREQLVLLQQDNVAHTDRSEMLLGKKMASTIAFWVAELA